MGLRRRAPVETSPVSVQKSEAEAAKGELRKMCAAQRDGLDVSLRRLAAERLAACGIGFAGAFAGSTISAYAAIGSELDAFPLLRTLADQGYRLCLPVITPLGNPLVFRAWAPDDPLVSAKWDIREPAASAPAVEPDVLLVPLLAFDDDGNRLGYGGGYYDRTLRRLRSMKPIIAIGLAYDTQEIGKVPVEPHDQRLDFVLTPTGGRKLG
jgi:5-formyltetrahydrofolate cyclo-ligase